MVASFVHLHEAPCGYRCTTHCTLLDLWPSWTQSNEVPTMTPFVAMILFPLWLGFTAVLLLWIAISLHHIAGGK